MVENIEKLPEVLKLAEKRNKTIPKMLKSGGYHIRRNKFLTYTFQGVFSCFVEGFDFYGGENLQEVRRLREAGIPVHLAYKHGSEGDAYSIRYICNKMGFSDIPNNTTYQAGLKMEERSSTRPFFHAEESLLSVTPQDMRAINAIVADEQLMASLPVSTQMALREYKRNVDSLVIASLKKSRRLQRDEKKMTGSFPEGGRSRSGDLTLPQPEFSAYYGQKDAMVASIVIDGAQATFPPDDLPKLHTKSKLLMVVGKPYPTSEIQEAIRGREAEFSYADYVVFKISDLLDDDRVEPKVLEKRARFRQAA